MTCYIVSFSPTGGTEAIANLLARTWKDECGSQTVDLTDPKTDFKRISFAKEDIALIAVPSFGGRVPQTAVDRIAALQGNGAKAVLICVYGNRAYEDTLVELEDTACEAGFQVTAAIAAVARHSIARNIAAGRPDKADQKVLTDFGKQIREKLVSGETKAPSIPGNRPYKSRGGKGMVPAATENCIRCGQCAGLCPVEAIDPDHPQNTDSERCISCMRCVSICPRFARKIDDEALANISAMLGKVCADRKECELYL